MRDTIAEIIDAAGLEPAPLSALLADNLWRSLQGQTLPPYDRIEAKRAALANRMSPDHIAERFGADE